MAWLQFQKLYCWGKGDMAIFYHAWPAAVIGMEAARERESGKARKREPTAPHAPAA